MRTESVGDLLEPGGKESSDAKCQLSPADSAGSDVTIPGQATKEIDKDLPFPEQFRYLVHHRIVGSNDNHFGAVKRLWQSLHQQGPDVRYFSLDVVPVGSDKRRKSHVLVVNLHGNSPTEQPFREPDHGTLPQVVGPGLEAQSKKGGPRPAERENPIQGRFEVDFVALKRGLQERHRDVCAASLMNESPQVLGETRTAECHPRPQIGRGDVQTPVLTYQPHYFQAVHVQRSGQTADL